MRDVTYNIHNIRAERRELEVAVARSIGNWLLDNKYSSIRRLTLAILDRIIETKELAQEHADVGAYANTLLLPSRQKTAAMWTLCATKAGWKGLENVRDCIQNELVTDYEFLIVCADVVRVFGEFAEEPAVRTYLSGLYPDWQHMAGKGKFRPKPVFAKPDKGENARIGWGHRHRVKGSGEQINEPFLAIPRSSVPLRGVEKYAFGDHSIIHNIDFAYGLQIEGGDVSGTTADTIAAMNWSGEVTGHGGDPFLHLLAIATMVPQGHHTIVECAWPLTRFNRFTGMDYRIGFYGTLAPGNGSLRTQLEHFDDDPRNKHVFVCKANLQTRMRWPALITIALHFDQPDEIAVYRDIAHIRSAYSFCVGGQAHLDALANFIKIKHPGLVGTQVADRALNRYWDQAA